MSLSEIRTILEVSPAHRVEPDSDVWLLDTGPWWRLFTGHEALESAKKRILDAAWRIPSPLFLLPPEPLEDDLAPFVTREGPAWRLNRARSAQDFYETEPASGLGNWQLYAADRALQLPNPDTFRTKPEAILQFMRAHCVTLPNRRVSRRHGLVRGDPGPSVKQTAA